MATLYWGPSGGTASGTWDGSTTTNWFTDLARTTPAGAAPTSSDDVVFDASSDNGTTFTVTMATGVVCRNITISGLDNGMTLAGSPTRWDIYGSLLWPATNLTRTFNAPVYFKSTTTGNTITTNGVTITSQSNVLFDGVGGEWTLGSALSFATPTSTGATIQVLNGTFKTGNFNITAGVLYTEGTATRAIELGSSTVALNFTNCINFQSSTGLTFNAGTSTITSTVTNPAFRGASQTFYNVTLSGGGLGGNAAASISEANTFNNLTIATPASGLRVMSFDSNQTISSTLTLGAANTAVKRICVRSDVVGTQRTLTVATLATLADVDFQDIKAAGASSPWSGTRIGDCGGNSSITVAAAGNKYWYSATGAGGNWSAAQWETSSGGTSPSVNNFPLPQDTVIFQDAGLNSGSTITLDAGWNLPGLDFSARTLSMTFAIGSQTPTIFGNFVNQAITWSSSTSAVWKWSKQGTATITSNGWNTPFAINVECGTGTVKFVDDAFVSNTGATGLTLTSGTIDLNNSIVGAYYFTSNNSLTRSIAFGTGKIQVIGNNATIVNMTVMTGFSYTGTGQLESTYSGSTGTRTFNMGQSGGATESNALSLKVTGGSDAFKITTTLNCKNFDTTGFSGTVSNESKIIYGNLTVGATTSWTAGGSQLSFLATSGTQEVTTNGVTLDTPITITAPGATVKLIDNLTIGSTRTTLLNSGTINLNDKTFTMGALASSNSNVRNIAFGTGKIVVSNSNIGVITMNTATNFTYTGSGQIEANYSGSTGTRTFIFGSTAGATESNALNIKVTAGSDAVVMNTTCKNFDATGFSGQLLLRTIYGSVVIPATATSTSSASSISFQATSGTQQFTTGGVILNQPVIIASTGATVEMQDALTIGSSRALTLNSGTFKLKAGTTNTVNPFVFQGTVGTPISLQTTLDGSRATISQATGTVNSNYLTVKDVVATGGAIFNALTGAGSSTSANNVNDGNNLGWYFTPPGATFLSFF